MFLPYNENDVKQYICVVLKLPNMPGLEITFFSKVTFSSWLPLHMPLLSSTDHTSQ